MSRGVNAARSLTGFHFPACRVITGRFQPIRLSRRPNIPDAQYRRDSKKRILTDGRVQERDWTESLPHHRDDAALSAGTAAHWSVSAQEARGLQPLSWRATGSFGFCFHLKILSP